MLPEGWRVGQVSDLFKSGGMVTDGDWIESKDQDPGGQIRLVQLADVGDGHFVDKSNRFINHETSERLKCTILREGDVLIARMPDPIGRACLFPSNQPPSITAVDVCVMRPAPSVSAEWLMFLINSPAVRRDIEAMASGTTRQRVTKSALLDLSIPIPPLPEQRRIAKILGSVDAAIEVTKAVIEQTKTVKEGLLQTLLTHGIGHDKFKDSPLGEIPDDWTFTKLGDHTQKIGSGVTPRGGSEAYKAEGIPLIRSQNVGWGEMLMEGVAYIDEVQHAKMSGTKLKNGDVLLNITGASIGRAAIYLGPNDQANVNQHVCIIRCRNEIHPGYLMSYLISELGQSEIELSQAGGNRQGLNFENIGAFRIPLPPIEEQIRISDLLATVDGQIAAENVKLNSLQVLKKGLMDDLLTGRVRVPEGMELAA